MNGELGRTILAWREYRGIAQLALADKLGVSRQRIWRWENQGVPECDVVLVSLAISKLDDGYASRPNPLDAKKNPPPG